VAGAALGLVGAPAGASSVKIDQEKINHLFDGQLMPDDMVQVLSHVDVLVPSATIRKGAAAVPFETSSITLPALSIRQHDKTYDLYDFLALNRVAGLMILKDGKVVMEQYNLGINEQTRWLSASMIKSLTSTLVGVAIQDGHIGSVQDQVVKYLPALKGSGYDGVTVEQILQMRSGVRWDETYNDPKSDRRQVLEMQYRQQPGEFLTFMATLKRAHQPGTQYNYSTGETYLVGSLLEAAVGKPVQDYLSEKLWQPLGMEQDGRWWVLSPEGPITAGGGYAATLRDYARLAKFYADKGVLNGQQLVPDAWFETATRSATPDKGYGYQWWTYDKPTDDPIHRGAFSARGVYGQSMYIHPESGVVIVILGAQSKTGGRMVVDYDAFHAAVLKALR
ncbi:MAG TPA: serine hydrolase, partial [Alcaligenes sp.]|nr:serine hydrolase [Alcaligenes sp.]HRL26652.1 serine hydrolase [Alcaligenes sp.]